MSYFTPIINLTDQPFLKLLCLWMTGLLHIGEVSKKLLAFVSGALFRKRSRRFDCDTFDKYNQKLLGYSVDNDLYNRWTNCAIQLMIHYLQTYWDISSGYLTIIKNYWARLSKILWFISGEEINYLLKPKTEANNLRDTDKSQYFAITEFNNCFIVRSLFFWSTKYVKSLSACLGNRSAIFTQECSFNYAWAEYYLQQNTYL